ncbi:MAG: hypothetical protein CMJ58_23165 [Planctomycetaceae bacterium]|nr:hypothetical protein [Planctomycetaceae bacterium]
MSTRSLSNLCAVIFLVLGALALSMRHHSREALRVAETTSQWRLTYYYDLQIAEDAPAKSTVDIGLPQETPNVKIQGEPEDQVPHQLHYRWLDPYDITGTQVLQVEANTSGQHSLTIEYELAFDPDANGLTRWADKQRLTAKQREWFLRDDRLLPKSNDSVTQVLNRLPRDEESTESLRLQMLYDFCRRDLQAPEPSESLGADEVPNVLSTKKATPLGRARTFVTLCRAEGIPARLVVGFELRQDSDIRSPQVWTEVYMDGRWLPFDPTNGFARRMPDTYFPVRFGGEEGKVWYVPLSSAMAVPTDRYSIERLEPPASLLAKEKKHPRQILDLTRLPLEMHQAMSLILLLPFGALITAVFRNIVGLKTFGTFAPALLAMSFIYADWGTGIVILAVVMTAGFTSRRWLERLRLLMVPRLSIVLTTIILCIMFGVSLLDYMNLTPSAQAVLLPMVILTTLTERYYVTSEEDGHAFAVKLSLGTLIVSAMCYAVLSWDAVGEWILAYPEAHLITIAVLMYIGRYTGYRLSELIRFRDFVKNEEG